MKGQAGLGLSFLLYRVRHGQVYVACCEGQLRPGLSGLACLWDNQGRKEQYPDFLSRDSIVFWNKLCCDRQRAHCATDEATDKGGDNLETGGQEVRPWHLCNTPNMSLMQHQTCCKYNIPQLSILPSPRVKSSTDGFILNADAPTVGHVVSLLHGVVERTAGVDSPTIPHITRSMSLLERMSSGTSRCMDPPCNDTIRHFAPGQSSG